MHAEPELKGRYLKECVFIISAVLATLVYPKRTYSI